MQKGPEFRRSSGSSLLQRSKPRSSEKALKAPCCNAASSGASSVLAFAATQKALELRSLLLLQRSFCCNGAYCSKLRAPESSGACCSATTSSKLLSFSRACLLGFSLLAKKKAFFFFWVVEKKKTFFFVFFVVEEKEEEP